MFSMTSFGAQIDETVNQGRGPYVFKISGQIYHYLGSLCPSNGKDPCFLQLYIYDTENEVENRMKVFGGKDSSRLRPEVVEHLVHILNEHNEMVRLFRTARNACNDQHVPDFKIKLYNVVGSREHQLPSSNILGAIVFESGPNSVTDYDVIIQKKGKIHSELTSCIHPTCRCSSLFYSCMVSQVSIQK